MLEGRCLLSATLSTPTADVDVQSSAADATLATANFGADPQLRVQLAPEASVSESFLSFDITSLASVGHAVLRLHGGQAGTPTDAVTVGVFNAGTSGFVEGSGTHAAPDVDNNPAGEITLNNRPGTTGGAGDAKLV
jgi:hypothetical protein